MRLTAATIAAALVGVSSACSLLTDTSGLTSTVVEGGDSSTTLDAGDASPSGDAMAASDGPLLEDAPPSDGSTDGLTSVDAQADAAPTCPSGSAVLCDGFERLALLGPWSGKKTTGGGAIDLASEGTRKFLRATSPGTSGTVDVDAELYADFPQTATAAYYDYDLRYSSLPGTATYGVEVQTIYFWKSGGGYSDIFLVLTPLGVFVVEQQGANETSTPVTLSAGAWHRVSFEVHIGGAFLVKVDGTTALSKTLASFVLSGPATASGGIAYGSRPPSALTVDIDNVVFRATP